MPVFNFFHWTEQRGYTLQADGALIQIEVSLPAALQIDYASKGIAIPPPASGFALIDTGAASTAVDEGVLTALGTPPLDVIPTSTPHGNGNSIVYPAQLNFPALIIQGLEWERVIGCNLQWITQDGKSIIALLGRDILRHFLLVYNGKSSDVTLAY